MNEYQEFLKSKERKTVEAGVGLPEYCTIFRKWEGDEEKWTPINNKNKENFPLDV